MKTATIILLLSLLSHHKNIFFVLETEISFISCDKTGQNLFIIYFSAWLKKANNTKKKKRKKRRSGLKLEENIS